jgi:hypothetical protein
MKPGFLTSEFWISVATQILAFLVITHVITPQDQEALAAALTKAIAAVFTIFAAARVVIQYVESRTALKRQDMINGKTAALVLLALAFLSPPTFAAAPPSALPFAVSPLPSHPHTCFFGWNRQDNQQTIKLLEQVLQNQQVIMQLLQERHGQPPAAQQPQVIVLSPPLQNIPLGGMPYQQIPLGGPPRQDIPLGTPPRQDIPLGLPPQQQIPLGGPPKQQIDPGAPPRQVLPLGAPPPMLPPSPTRYQWTAAPR